MLFEEREQIILNFLKTNKICTTPDLAELTGTSNSTIRRDLKKLKKKGLITKIHGGAKYFDTTNSFINNRVEHPSYSEKNDVALIAQNFIKSGDTIFLGAGVTNILLSRYIKDRTDLLVVTTNINVVLELSSSKKITVLLLGGEINNCETHIETLSEYTLESIGNYFFDKVFITVDGIDLENGYSINSRLQIPLYNYLLKNCEQFYLIADRSKFDKRAFIHLCNMNEIPNVITNFNTKKKYLDFYKSNNIKVTTKTTKDGTQ